MYICMYAVCICIYIYIYIYMGIACFTAPTQCFQVLSMCTFERCCARVRDVAHVSQHLCTCHRSCARFTSPLITFVFNCIHTERILISKSIGATKRVLPIYIYIYIYVYIYRKKQINDDICMLRISLYILLYSTIFYPKARSALYRGVHVEKCIRNARK